MQRGTRRDEPGGLICVIITVVVLLLLGVIGWYWHISHVHGVTPASVQAAERAPADSAGKHIYPEAGEAKADIQAALVTAKRSGKRVILDFGGDWCPDCQVLDIYFHQSPNAELLAKNFVKVNVNIGHMDANVEVAERYGVPLKKGVPALAVLSADGRLLYAQKAGEFESMRNMQSGSVTEFLNTWKPKRG